MALAILPVALAAAAICETAAGAQEAGSKVCERQMALAAAKYHIPLGFLYAIALTETGRRNSLQPWALNIEGKPLYPRSRAQALRAFRQARAQGKKLIDLGCMQINYHFHGKKFTSAADMLEPSRNVDYAAAFLKRLYVREGSWTMAAARYHAGRGNDAAQKRYICLVIRNLAATGFGKWTPQARNFCK